MPGGSPKDRTIRTGPWPAGLNTAVDASELREGELASAINVEVESGGSITRRQATQGLREIDSLGLVTVLFPTRKGQAVHFGVWNESSQTMTVKFALVEEADSESAPTITFPALPETSFDGSTESSISPFEAPLTFIDAAGGVIFACCNRTVKVRDRTDGQVWIDLPNVPTDDRGFINTDTSPTGNVAQSVMGTDTGFFPESDLIATWTFGASGTFAMATIGRTLRWSLPLTPGADKGFQDWDTAHKFAFPGEGPITAVQQVQDSLLVFTKGRAWRIYGNSPPESFVMKVSDTVGCSHFHNVAETATAAVWYDDGSRSLWAFTSDGSLQDVWAQRVSLPRGTLCRAVITADEKVFAALAFPDGTAGVYVTDLRIGSIVSWTVPASSLGAVDTGKFQCVLAGTSEPAGGIVVLYEPDAEGNDSGDVLVPDGEPEPFEASIKTSVMRPDPPDQRARWRRAFGWVSRGTPEDITVAVTVDSRTVPARKGRGAGGGLANFGWIRKYGNACSLKAVITSRRTSISRLASVYWKGTRSL